MSYIYMSLFQKMRVTCFGHFDNWFLLKWYTLETKIFLIISHGKQRDICNNTHKFDYKLLLCSAICKYSYTHAQTEVRETATSSRNKQFELWTNIFKYNDITSLLSRWKLSMKFNKCHNTVSGVVLNKLKKALSNG